MKTEKEPKAGTPKKGKRRILKLVLVLIVFLIVLVFLLVPALISSGKGRQIILAKINDSIAGKTDFTDLSMGWFKGIKIADFGFNDNAGQVSVRVKQIATKPHYGSLLTGNLSFGQTLIDKPNVQINLKAQKSRSPGQEVPADTATKSIVLPVKRLELVLNDGNLKVTDPEAGTVEFSQINSRLNLRPPGQQTDFDLDMAVARAGKTSEIQVASRITTSQKTGWSLKGTSGSLTIDINDLDLESLGPIFALAGVGVRAKGLVDSHLKSEIQDGRFETLNVDIRAKNLDITGTELKGDRLQTGDLGISMALSQAKETINIEDLKIQSDWADVTASGVVPTTFKSLADLLAADSNYSLEGTFNCDVASVLSQMPKTLGLKEGMQVTSGRLSGNIETPTRAGQKQIQARATLTALEGQVEGKKVALSEPVTAEAQISSDKAGIIFDKLNASAPFAKVNCAGNTESLKYNLEVDLAKLQLEFGQFIDIGELQMAGRFLGTGDVSFQQDKTTAAGSSQVKDLLFTSPDGLAASEPKADLEFAVEFDKKQNIVTISSVRIDASLGRLSVKDSVVPLSQEATKPMNVVVNAANLDLAKIRPFAIMFASLPKEMQLSGIAESEISVSSEKHIYSIATDSTTIKGLKLTYPGQKPFEPNEASLILEAEIDPKQKAVNIKKLQLESPQIKIRKGEFSQLNEGGTTKLEGQAELEYDWSAVSTMIAPYLPEGLTLQGTREDAVNFAGEYPAGQTDKLLPNLRASAKVGFEQAGYMGLNFGSTDVDIQIQNGLLKIAPFATTVNDGQFNFAAQADFTQKPALFTTGKPMQIVKDIKVNDETTRTLLKYLSPIFANAVNVSGIANLSCEKLAIPISAAAKNRAEIIGTISMNQLRLESSDLLGSILSLVGTSGRGTDITIHPTRFVLQEGFLRYDDMQMDIGDNPVNFKGVIGLDKSLEMTVTLPYTTGGRTVRIGRESVGQRITLPLKGTVDKPQLDTAKLLEQQLKDQLRKGLEGLFK